MVHRAGADSLETISDDDLEDEIEPQQVHIWILAIVVCLDIWILGAVGTHWWATNYFADNANVNIDTVATDVTESKETIRGLFGDSFGAVTALVSALAFAGMIVAYWLQRHELRLQRKELRDSRNEMRRQTTQFKTQNDNLERQRFENLFYNMLNLQQTIVEGLRYEYYDEERVTVPLDKGYTTDKRFIQREVKGRNVFRYLFEQVQLNVEGVPRNVVNGYRWFLYYKGFKDYDTTLIPTHFDHYFRHLYKTVKFVDSQKMEFDDKYKYVSFLRGTLSRYELVWLFYNTLNPDFYKFKELIERYSLLKALRIDLLTLSKETNDYYKDLGISQQELTSQDFNVGDFEFYLTDGDEEEKYHLSAIWNRNDMQNGKEHFEKWRSFIEEKAGQISH